MKLIYKKEVKSISGVAQSIKYVLRGIFLSCIFPFILYFKFCVRYGYILSLSPHMDRNKNYSTCH